jgi:hypothetical protein
MKLVQWTLLLTLAGVGCGDDKNSETSGQGAEKKDAGTLGYQDCAKDADCGDAICRNNRCTQACTKATTKPASECPASERGFPVWCTTHDKELWCEEILL